MNIGFLLIAMLETKLQNPWVMLPIVGHDAQSIGAILGALTGFRIGAEKWDAPIRALSAEMPEILDQVNGSGFPMSYMEMADKVAQTGKTFIEFYDHFELTGSKPRPLRLDSPKFHLSVFPVESHVLDWRGDHKLTLEYENLSEVPQEIQLVMNSPSLIFKNPIVNLTAADWEIVELENTCRLSAEALEHLVDSDVGAVNAAFPYSIEVIIDSEMNAKIQRGLPFYGSWMLIGPFFINNRDDEKTLQRQGGRDVIFTPPEAQAPEFTYLGKRYSLEQIRRLAETKNLDEFPFQTIPFQPSGFQIDFAELLHGHGPKTLFLFTHLHSKSVQTVHLVIYSSAIVTLWCNGEPIVQKAVQQFVERPHLIPIQLSAGLNDILIQLTPVNEYLNFYFAVRESDEKGAPGIWSTDLIPFL
ncbi:MAG: hypothetical protein EHM72_10235 [Calditrichaeota bacterium]|nr:MAG: hypothetical protein EHM72_10235 [Calditrichota bacterium]